MFVCVNYNYDFPDYATFDNVTKVETIGDELFIIGEKITSIKLDNDISFTIWRKKPYAYT